MRWAVRLTSIGLFPRRKAAHAGRTQTRDILLFRLNCYESNYIFKAGIF